jgi:hypothetical protein
MANIADRIQHGILGDINPRPSGAGGERPRADDDSLENEESMVGGSRHDRTQHSGARDVTEGVRGGTGATGGDIGNRPE